MRNAVSNFLNTKIISLLVLIFAMAQFSGCALESGGSVADPLEPVNRGIFWFNLKADTYAIEPLAKAYNRAIPDPVQDKIGNFYDNLRFPSVFVSSLVQLKFQQALEQTGRFLVNTTLGMAGLFDPASDLGLDSNEDDFGIALGYQGVGEGFYIVLPFLGPSNARDTIGRLVDLALDPLFFVEFLGSTNSKKSAALNSLLVLKYLDARASALEAVDTAKSSSVDLYLFTQGAYHQYRQGLIYDGDVPDEEFGDL